MEFMPGAVMLVIGLYGFMARANGSALPAVVDEFVVRFSLSCVLGGAFMLVFAALFMSL